MTLCREFILNTSTGLSTGLSKDLNGSAIGEDMDWIMRKIPSKDAQFAWCRLPSEEMNWWGVQICTPHGIELRIALTHAFDVLLWIRAVGEGINSIDDAEVVFLFGIVPICAYLPYGKLLYLLWHIYIAKLLYFDFAQ